MVVTVSFAESNAEDKHTNKVIPLVCKYRPKFAFLVTRIRAYSANHTRCRLVKYCGPYAHAASERPVIILAGNGVCWVISQIRVGRPCYPADYMKSFFITPILYMATG